MDLAELPRRTSVDELLEMIFEQFGMFGIGQDARIGRGSRSRMHGSDAALGRDAHTVVGQSGRHGLVAGRSRCIVHGL